MAKGFLSTCDMHEQVHIINDAQTGLRGMIAIHSTGLGPALGGCRLWHYDSVRALENDALRLSRNMSYQHALAGLPFGGGQAVLQLPTGPYERAALLRVFADAVEALGGLYLTTRDLGTTHADMNAVRMQTRHVAGRKAGTDASRWIALGVFEAMKVSTRIAGGADLNGMTVAVQGAGRVGASLCRMLARAGAKLVLADSDDRRAGELAASLGARVVPFDAIAGVDADIFAPCAARGVLNARSIPLLKARVVCGAADNQLETEADGDLLLARGITYAPDYIVNAGGIMTVAAELLGETTHQLETRVRRIGARLDTVLRQAEIERTAPTMMADQMARQIIGAAQRVAA